MLSAEQILTPDVTEKFTDFESLGGIIDFKLFRMTGTASTREVHLQTAQKTLERLKQDSDNYFKKLSISSGTNRNSYFKIVFTALSLDDGKQISPEEFFGPYFNFKKQKPILLGKIGKPFQAVKAFNDYYYYDDSEVPENIITIKTVNEKYITQGYTDAFLNPPYSFGNNMANLEIGKFFLEFNQFLLDDINNIIVYKWATECSNYFEVGKEWWGSFFWTVYNPIKDWYIGVTASTTD